MAMPQSNLLASQSVDQAAFENIYAGPAPWDIGKPQPAFVAIADRVAGPILDAGCGTGEHALFFAARGRQVVGIAEVAKAAYSDPTADDAQWVAVDLKPVKPLKESVPLAAIRYNDKLANLPLIRQSQLSVMGLTKEEFDTIVSMGSGKKKK